MTNIRSPALMRGRYHELLTGVLLEAIARRDGITQDSLASVAGKHQTTVGDILKQGTGTFDLDEADALLRHVGSSLKDFANDPTNVVVPPHAPQTKTQRALASLVRGMEDGQLKIALAIFRSVKKAGARAGKKSGRRHVADRARATRRTGGTP